MSSCDTYKEVEFGIEQVTKVQRSSRDSSTVSLTSTVQGVSGQCHAPAALLPGKRPGTHCIVGCVGPGAEYPAPNEIRTADRPAIASRYTDYAIPPHLVTSMAHQNVLNVCYILPRFTGVVEE